MAPDDTRLSASPDGNRPRRDANLVDLNCCLMNTGGVTLYRTLTDPTDPTSMTPPQYYYNCVFASAFLLDQSGRPRQKNNCYLGRDTNRATISSR